MAATKGGNVNVSVVNTAIKAVIAETDSTATIKQEQEYILTEFLRGKDVFAILLTGFGKGLIFFNLLLWC